MQSWELRVFCPCPWTVRKSVNCTQSWELLVFCPYPWAVRKAESFWCSLTETLWWRQNVKRGKIPQNAEISSWSKSELAIVSPKSHIYNGYKINGMFNHKTFTADHVCWSRVPLKNVMWCIIKNKIKKGDTRHCVRHTLDVPADRHAAEGSGRLRQTHGGQHFPGRAAGRTDGCMSWTPPASSSRTCPLTSCPSRSRPNAPRWCTCIATLGQYSCPSTSRWRLPSRRLAWLRKTLLLTRQPPDSSLIKVCDN